MDRGLKTVLAEPVIRPVIDTGGNRCTQCGSEALYGSGTYKKTVWEQVTLVEDMVPGHYWDRCRQRHVTRRLPIVKKALYDYTTCPTCRWTIVHAYGPHFLGWEGYNHEL